LNNIHRGKLHVSFILNTC